jgi:hypothetical protein
LPGTQHWFRRAPCLYSLLLMSVSQHRTALTQMHMLTRSHT